MSDSTNICLACGICCDGTLIGFVELSSEEIPAIKKIMDIEEAEGHGFFLQPCKKYCDGCTIYADRPKQCGLFKCGLLNSVEQKDLPFKDAVDIVEVVKQKRLEIEEKLVVSQIDLKSPSFYFKMVELKKLLLKKESESSSMPIDLDLMKALNELDFLMSSKFGVAIN